MTEPRHLDLVDRLRGQYRLPVDDGAGPLNGSMTFSREFPTSPIQKEAAEYIERLRQALETSNSMLEALMIQLYSWEHKPVVNVRGQMIKNTVILAYREAIEL